MIMSSQVLVSSVQVKKEKKGKSVQIICGTSEMAAASGGGGAGLVCKFSSFSASLQQYNTIYIRRICKAWQSDSHTWIFYHELT